MSENSMKMIESGDDSPQTRRSSRRDKGETSYKAKAFEKFRQLKKGVRNKYEVEEVDNVYEVVEEKEYVKEVLSRYEDDWIVDDDGSGYVEDGRDIFDDDLDLKSIEKDSNSAKKGKGTKRKSKNLSENAGKGKLQHMLSTMPSKQKTEVKIDDEDEMLSEILGEINSDSSPSTSIRIPKKKDSYLEEKLAAKNYLKKISNPIKKCIIERKSFQKKNVSFDSPSTLKVPNNVSKNSEMLQKPNNISENSEMLQKNFSEQTNGSTTKDFTDNIDIDSQSVTDETEKSDKLNIEQFEDDFTFDDFDGDLDMTEFEEEESQIANAADKITDIQAEFETEWENFANTTIDNNNESILDKTDIPLIEVEGNKVFRFFWWDAYEDPINHKGVVFLFGKTYNEKTKSYMSCCVAVRNIDRRLFVLPKPFEVGNDGEPTETPVTFKKMYEEFHEVIMKPLGVKAFRSKPITKKYAFDPDIPTEAEYMEVRYPATDPRINTENLSKKCRTISKIFGVNTNFLEILFLDRKIKGPCWLDISNPVPVSNQLSWCKFEVNCTKIVDLKVTVFEKPLPPPPLVVVTINMRSYINRKTSKHEIVMLSCLAHRQYAVNKLPPNPPFQHHFCIFTCPSDQKLLPLNMYDALRKYKATKIQKTDSEKALLNYFINQFVELDPDLIVGHDLQGYQLNILADRLTKMDNNTFNKLGRLKRTDTKGLENSLFLGRLVCDIKITAKELIKSRSFDLEYLCQNVLDLNVAERIELEPQDIPKMFTTPEDVLNLITFTMQDAKYIIKIMYQLNAIPLALQITNIAGNVMSKTLMGGRAERNEFLLLHAFSEKGYILPDKTYKKRGEGQQTSKKKPSYAGGLVLDPKIGFYDKLILLMDFNSLYPSIIQEYNICFTTLPISENVENLCLPDTSLPAGVLPTEIRKLVESRRQVKNLMAKSDLCNDLKIQYDIRQMALKLTANSMYGCLGFSNSRFYAKNLAALITQKGREILTNTKHMIEKMNYDVVYGDTDSIMINTYILDYDQVFKIGVKIKQEVNKLYKQVELDIDGVFKYLLLLRKKKYAALTLFKNKTGNLVTKAEYKGLEIIRRDWSQISCEAGKYVLEQILSDQSVDDKIANIHNYLRRTAATLQQGKVPMPLLIITKQLTKDPKMYANTVTLPHVQVALRYNKTSGGHFRAGDTVPYVICDDGTSDNPSQRAYHVDEMKNSRLKIDIEYYLAQQIHPVVARIIEPIQGMDSYRVSECLGMDMTKIKKPKQASVQWEGENISKPEIKYRHIKQFKFICYSCKQENIVGRSIINTLPFLEKCTNSECNVRPVEYLPSIQNQLILTIQNHIKNYYKNVLTCEDPGCSNETRQQPLKFVGKFPVCNMCEKGVMYRIYTEQQLYRQLGYFLFIFDFNEVDKRMAIKEDIEPAYKTLQETAQKYMNHSGYGVVHLGRLFDLLDIHVEQHIIPEKNVPGSAVEDYDMDEQDEV